MGSNCLDERSSIFGVGPITVDPEVQSAGVGRRLMQAVMGDPPPRELRRAVDGLFMMPLRRALDRAPRASRAPSSPVIMPEGRA